MAVNVRLLQARKELVEKYKAVQQGFVDKRKNYEKETQDVANKTNKSEAARAGRKASMDAESAKAEMDLADKKSQSAATGMVLGGISALVGAIGAVVKAASDKMEDKKQRDLEKKAAGTGPEAEAAKKQLIAKEEKKLKLQGKDPSKAEKNVNDKIEQRKANPAQAAKDDQKQSLQQTAKTIDKALTQVMNIAKMFAGTKNEFNAQANDAKAEKAADMIGNAAGALKDSFKESFAMRSNLRQLGRQLEAAGINYKDVMKNGRIDMDKLNQEIDKRNNDSDPNNNISDSDVMSMRTQSAEYNRAYNKMTKSDLNTNGTQVVLNRLQRGILDKVKNGQALTDEEKEELNKLAQDMGIDITEGMDVGAAVLQKVEQSQKIAEAIRAAETGTITDDQKELLQKQGVMLNNDGSVNRESLQEIKRDFYGAAGMAVESNFDNTEQGQLLRRAQDLELMDRMENDPDSLSDADKQRLKELGVMNQDGSTNAEALASKKESLKLSDTDKAALRQMGIYTAEDRAVILKAQQDPTNLTDAEKQALENLGLMNQDGTVNTTAVSDLRNSGVITSSEQIVLRRAEQNQKDSDLIDRMENDPNSLSDDDKKRLKELGVMNEDGKTNTTALAAKKEQLKSDAAVLKKLGVLDSNGRIDTTKLNTLSQNISQNSVQVKAQSIRQDQIYSMRNLSNDTLNKFDENGNLKPRQTLNEEDKKVLKGLGLLNEDGSVKTEELKSRMSELRDTANINDYRREQSAAKRRSENNVNILNSFGILGFNVNRVANVINNIGRDISAYFKDLGEIDSFGGFFSAIGANGNNINRNRALGNNIDDVTAFANGIQNEAERERFLEAMANAGGNADIAYNRRVSQVFSGDRFTTAAAIAGDFEKAKELFNLADEVSRGTKKIEDLSPEQIAELKRMGILGEDGKTINVQSLDNLQRVVDPVGFQKRVNKDMETMGQVMTNGRFDQAKYNALDPAKKAEVDKLLNRYNNVTQSTDLKTLQDNGVLNPDGSFNLQAYMALDPTKKALVNTAIENIGGKDALEGLVALQEQGVLNTNGTFNKDAVTDANREAVKTALGKLGITIENNDFSNVGNVNTSLNNKIASEFTSVNGRSQDTNILQSNGVLNTNGTFNLQAYNDIKTQANDPSNPEKQREAQEKLKKIDEALGRMGVSVLTGQSSNVIDAAIRTSNQGTGGIRGLTTAYRNANSQRVVTASSVAQDDFMKSLDQTALFDMMRGSVYEASKLDKQKEKVGSKIDDIQKKLDKEIEKLIEEIDATRPENAKLTDADKERLKSELRSGNTSYATTLVNDPSSSLNSRISEVAQNSNDKQREIASLNYEKNNLTLRINTLNNNFEKAKQYLGKATSVDGYSFDNVENKIASRAAERISQALQDGDLSDEEFENITKQFGAEYVAKAFNAMSVEDAASLIRTSGAGVERFANFIAKEYKAEDQDKKDNQDENNVTVRNNALGRIMAAERVAQQLDLQQATSSGVINSDGTIKITQDEINALDPNKAEDKAKLDVLKNLGLIDDDNNLISDPNKRIAELKDGTASTIAGRVANANGLSSQMDAINQIATTDLAIAAGRGAVGAQTALNNSIKNLSDDQIKKVFDDLAENNPAAAASLIIALEKNGKQGMVDGLLNGSDNNSFWESAGNFFGIGTRDSTKILAALANQDPETAARLFNSGRVSTEMIRRVAEEDPRAMANVLNKMSAEDASKFLKSLNLGDTEIERIVGSMDREKALELVDKGNFSQSIKNAALGASSSATDDPNDVSNLTTGRNRDLTLRELKKQGIVDSAGNINKEKLAAKLEDMSPEQASNLLLSLYGNTPAGMKEMREVLGMVDKGDWGPFASDDAAKILSILANKTGFDINALLSSDGGKTIDPNILKIMKEADSDILGDFLTSVSANSKINSSIKNSIYSGLSDTEITDAMETMTDQGAANVLSDLYGSNNQDLQKKARAIIQDFNTTWYGGESDDNIERMGNILLNLKEKNGEAFGKMLDSFMKDDEGREYLSEMVMANREFGKAAFRELGQRGNYDQLQDLFDAVRKEEETIWSNIGNFFSDLGSAVGYAATLRFGSVGNAFTEDISETAIDMFAQLSLEDQVKLLENGKISDRQAAIIISNIATNEGGDILKKLADKDPERAAKILSEMDKKDRGAYFAAIKDTSLQSKIASAGVTNGLYDVSTAEWFDPFINSDEDYMFDNMNNEQTKKIIEEMLKSGNAAQAAQILANFDSRTTFNKSDARYSIFNALSADDQVKLLNAMLNTENLREKVGGFLNKSMNPDRLINNLLDSRAQQKALLEKAKSVGTDLNLLTAGEIEQLKALGVIEEKGLNGGTGDIINQTKLQETLAIINNVNLANSIMDIKGGIFTLNNSERLRFLSRLNPATRARLFPGAEGKSQFQEIFNRASTGDKLAFFASVTNDVNASKNGQSYNMSAEDWALMEGLNIENNIISKRFDDNGNFIGGQFNDPLLNERLNKAEEEANKFQNFRNNLTDDAIDQIAQNNLQGGRQIGGAKEESTSQIRRKGLNWAIMGLDMSMAGIKFFLEQLDKLREAEDQKNEAKKKMEAALKLEKAIMKELNRQSVDSAEAGTGSAPSSATSGG